MSKKIRLHLGCGEVYLKGYVNIDAVGDLASENPELKQKNETDIDNYFKRPYIKRLLGHDKRGRNVVDVIADVRDLKIYKDNSVDSLLSVNLIDHFRFQDLPALIKEWHRILKVGGELTIDVGDARGNAKMLTEAKNSDELEWALRLLYCHSRDQYDSHKWGYTPEYLEELMQGWGFEQKWTKNDYIKHVYPSFQSCFVKIVPQEDRI